MLYPLIFKPIFKERVWGGRNIEKHFGKELPPNIPVGESWEVSDRPGDVSVIANGPLAGKDLRWLVENQAAEVYGSRPSPQSFPLLVKILDAQDVLSLQVHPPATVASKLGGEPKTELWYVAHAEPGAYLYAGLKKGFTREEFEARLKDGTVAQCAHRIDVKTGDAMFLPSGRIHAIGPGLVIFEIQQNSDTTYRVFDWNRVGLDGKPRELHVEQSLASIDFNDYEPAPIKSIYSRNATVKVRYIVDHPLFRVDAMKIKRRSFFNFRSSEPYIFGILQGRLILAHNKVDHGLKAGDFCLIPASVECVGVRAESQVELLHIQIGSGEVRDA
jgi:mannose-6-phosphate isomerase